MKLPAPRPGLVIRFSFLWSNERDAGLDEAAKDRPCAIVVATKRTETGDINTIVASITHSPPEDARDSIEIPQIVCRALGLDHGRHWLRLEELNSFTWPGFDLRPIPGRDEDCVYGMLPPGLFEQLRLGILERQKAKRLRLQPRDVR
jgi:hypothetical protein